MVWWGGTHKKKFFEAFKVADQVSQAAKDKERERNKEILSHLIDITLYLARQGMPFRGDDETLSSQNQGNFLELVELFSKYDRVIKLHLDAIKEQQGPGKRPLISLLSNRSQNDIIKALATSVRRVIQAEMQECETFSIRFLIGWMKPQMCRTQCRFPLLSDMCTTWKSRRASFRCVMWSQELEMKS